MRKDVRRLAEAYSKLHPTKMGDIELYKEFCVSFTSKDVSVSTNGDKGVKVTARIPQEDFDDIIYANGIYIAEYLKKKGIVL